MSYRFMRVIVFFDLPVGTAAERRVYACFRKALVKEGFLMLQESVYCKLALNATAAQTVMESVRRIKPPAGLVQMLMITEKQYSRMEFVVGEFRTEVVDTDERVVIL